jgi:hypothetical protein
MKNFVALASTVILLGMLIHPVFAQREVEPNDLKISPSRYRNSTIVIKDYFFNRRAAIPASLTAAG